MNPAEDANMGSGKEVGSTAASEGAGAVPENDRADGADDAPPPPPEEESPWVVAAEQRKCNEEELVHASGETDDRDDYDDVNRAARDSAIARPHDGASPEYAGRGRGGPRGHGARSDADYDTAWSRDAARNSGGSAEGGGGGGGGGLGGRDYDGRDSYSARKAARATDSIPQQSPRDDGGASLKEKGAFIDERAARDSYEATYSDEGHGAGVAWGGSRRAAASSRSSLSHTGHGSYSREVARESGWSRDSYGANARGDGGGRADVPRDEWGPKDSRWDGGTKASDTFDDR